MFVFSKSTKIKLIYFFMSVELYRCYTKFRDPSDSVTSAGIGSQNLSGLRIWCNTGNFSAHERSRVLRPSTRLAKAAHALCSLFHSILASTPDCGKTHTEGGGVHSRDSRNFISPSPFRRSHFSIIRRCLCRSRLKRRLSDPGEFFFSVFYRRSYL